MILSPVMKRFILHWGEMGDRWGISRSVAQIHALLYVTGKPLNAEEIADSLSIARSNVSMSLKELQTWGIVRVVHVMGDRRDHFDTLTSVWDMFLIVLDERKRREVDPTVQVLRECVHEAEAEGDAAAFERARIQELLELFEMMSGWYTQMRRIPMPMLKQLAKMGDKVAHVIGKAAG